MQPVAFDAIDVARGEFEVENRHDFIDLSQLAFSWVVEQNGEEIAGGELPGLMTAAGDKDGLAIPLPRVEPCAGCEYFLTVQAIAKPGYQALVTPGSIVAWEQFSLPLVGAEKEEPLSGSAPKVHNIEGVVRISGEAFRVEIDRESGLLTSLERGGVEFLESPLVPHFWRAPVDNDRGAGIPEALSVWRSLADTRVLDDLHIEATEHAVIVEVLASYGNGRLRWQTRYSVSGNGDIEVHNKVEPNDDTLPEFYRVGMTVTASGEFDRLRWFGRGPHSSYADRNNSAAVGLYEGDLADQFHDYSRPQETGNKVDVRWLSVFDAQGASLTVVGQPLLSITALPFAYTDLDYVPGVNRHGAELVPTGITTLNIDLAQMGVGGDNSWGFWPLPQYRLPLQPYEYTFVLRSAVENN
jgi:beta-galactosidase